MIRPGYWAASVQGYGMSDIKRDLLQLRKRIERRVNMPDLPVQEKAELFVALNLVKKQIRTST